MNIKHHSKSYIGPLLLTSLLNGCNFDVNVIGEGTVRLNVAEKVCTAYCADRSINKIKYERLTAVPEDGYDFIGFVTHTTGKIYGGPYSGIPLNDYRAHDTLAELFYGFGAYPEATAASLTSRNTAIFFPTAEILETANIGGSYCVLDTSLQLYCWGRSGDRDFEHLGLIDDILVDSVNANLCALSESGLNCWNDISGENWIIPEHIVNPLEMIFYRHELCVIHENEALNQLDCFAKDGTVNPDTPVFTHPISMQIEAGVLCVEDEDATVCW